MAAAVSNRGVVEHVGLVAAIIGAGACLELLQHGWAREGGVGTAKKGGLRNKVAAMRGFQLARGHQQLSQLVADVDPAGVVQQDVRKGPGGARVRDALGGKVDAGGRAWHRRHWR